jgi:hypothetical protein
VPDFGADIWADFVALVDMRDGLIHASVSRPERMKPPDPNPDQRLWQFYAREAGWAVGVARRLLLTMHEGARIDAPGWLVSPETLPT